MDRKEFDKQCNRTKQWRELNSRICEIDVILGEYPESELETMVDNFPYSTSPRYDLHGGIGLQPLDVDRVIEVTGLSRLIQSEEGKRMLKEGIEKTLLMCKRQYQAQIEDI